MPIINFTSALKRFYPDLHPVQIKGNSIAELLLELDKIYPNLSDYLVDEHGVLRDHINIFIGDKLIPDRTQLTDFVAEKAEILIFQALSGG